MQSRGADPSIKSENFEPYLSPGRKVPIELAIEDEDVRGKLKALEDMYKDAPKAKEPHPDIGCWWALYDHGLDAIKGWPSNEIRTYPGERCSSLPQHSSA